MKKRMIVSFIVGLGLISLAGCENKKISNDIISINQYVGLEVNEPPDEDDAQIVSEFEKDIWDELLANCTVKAYPKEELENLIHELKVQYSYVIHDDGSTSSELIRKIHGMTVEELAKEQLKKKYAVELIAEKEGLTLTNLEYKTELAKRAKDNGISSTEYENMFGYEKLYEEFQEERVMAFLKENL